jgi:SAM-dependent MidA family methyltransferase
MSWIVDEITKRGGEVFFDEFMELALYHPRHGYYVGEKPRYGRAGDFLTAPTASGWYARVIARLLTAIAAKTRSVCFVDVASGDGAMIHGVLDRLGTAASEVLDGIISIERSEALRSVQKQSLVAAPVEVRWARTVTDIASPPMPCVVHASELYDALPVARVVGCRDGIEELVVGVSAGELEWLRRPPRSEVVAYFERHGVDIENGQIAEANLGAEALHARMLGAMGDRGGLSLTLDYGYEARRLYDPRGRRGGSLTTYHNHRLGRDPLATPGRIDVTAHVNWEDLRRAANAGGWQEIGLWPLAEFLVLAGLAAELDARGLGIDAELDASTFSERQEVKRLLDPEGMGSDLKMLVQATEDMVDVAKRALSLD